MPTTVGIVSIGEMGLGIATLLLAHDFLVITTLGSRSQATKSRALSVNIRLVPDDVALVEECDVLLSIVPPKDAFATAERVRVACENTRRTHGRLPLYYLDLNAISPRSACKTADALASSANIIFIDGGIIGGPPKHKSPETGDSTTNPTTSWKRPSIPVSGPTQLHDLQPDGARLTEILNLRHISPTIGTASGLKMCFASLTKGFTSLAIQSFTTAHTLGVLDHLSSHLAEFSPKTGQLAEAGLTGMPPKAYRWAGEMRQIDETFREDGGFEAGVFEQVAKVYEFVAEETVLGEERTEVRVRGRTGEDVAMAVREGIARKAKME